MSSGLVFAADSSRPTTNSGSLDARIAPSLRWMKIMNVLLIAPPLILLVLFPSWTQVGAGLLVGFGLVNLFLVVTHLQSQRNFQKICRTFARMNAFPISGQNVYDLLATNSMPNLQHQYSPGRTLKGKRCNYCSM